MNKSIFTIVIMLLAFCGCHSSLKGRVGAAFSPGYTDGCLLNTRIYDSIKEVDSIYKVTSSDLAFLSNCLTKYRRDTKQRVTSPYMFIKMDSVLYILGHNRIVLSFAQQKYNYFLSLLWLNLEKSIVCFSLPLYLFLLLIILL